MTLGEVVIGLAANRASRSTASGTMTIESAPMITISPRPKDASPPAFCCRPGSNGGIGDSASATSTISTDGRRAKALVSASATIGMIANIATIDRPRSAGCRNTWSTSLGVARKPKLKTVIRMLACRASTTACCSVIVVIGARMAASEFGVPKNPT